MAELVKVIPDVAQSEPAKVFLTVFAPVMGLALGRGAYGVLAKRTPLLAAGYSKAFNDDPKRMEEHAKANENNDDYHEVMYRSFRLMMDAAHPSVIEALGYMAGRYSLGNVKPDAHFRAIGRMLCDLEDVEFAELRAMLREVLLCESKVGGRGVSLGLEKVQTDAEGADERVLAIGRADAPPLVINTYPSAARLLFILKRERFATNSTEPWDENEDESLIGSTMWISFAMLRKILRTIDPQPST